MQNRSILLVEDSQDDEALTKRAFHKARVKNEVVVARDGAEALEYLFCTGKYATRSTSDLPQVVLLDLHLPKVDGIEVLRRIRADERTRLLPVIILTSSREEKDLLRGYEGGANSYIVKPIDAEQFDESIQQLGMYWLLLNEAMP
ncbi:MAG: response regulator [Bacteriovoracia bacterium]